VYATHTYWRHWTILQYKPCQPETRPIVLSEVTTAGAKVQQAGGPKSFRGHMASVEPEGVEFEVPRVETPKASRGWGMRQGSHPQPTRGFVGAS